jgi:hypothetical protein
MVKNLPLKIQLLYKGPLVLKFIVNYTLIAKHFLLNNNRLDNNVK